MERAAGCMQGLGNTFYFPWDFVSLMSPKVDHVQASYEFDWLGRLGTVQCQHCRPRLSKLRKSGGNAVAL